MIVFSLINFLKRFKKAEVLINNQPICFEAYQDQTGKLIVNLKVLDKNEKSLDESEKI